MKCGGNSVSCFTSMSVRCWPFYQVIFALIKQYYSLNVVTEWQKITTLLIFNTVIFLGIYISL